ncbi:methyl-accepting chemotaxis protein TlpC [Paraliobacillus quinghaiensis]|uniref:Methyl-accepting chemotaxis protein TlpC n=1 Tax=Paraliobacillus quinghaiensis TaxID=470815 RepID=A0A917TI54_9BACI|nr:methyl-accepting chemotaxis protein [Paraliobacillus quinghaiensis]GGM23565.1 methyl-accepting chemotaxis protein TlpC [Paraliobacillus quinghaiensis]
MGIRMKLILFVTISFLLGTSAIGVYSVWQVESKTIEAAQEKLESDLELGRALIDERFPGDWSIRDGVLFKGNEKMEENFAIVDQIGELTGDTVTIFKGDTRVSTNVLEDDGTRAVNTTVSEEIVKEVLENGNTYIGEANVVGTINQTAYEPIMDSEENIIGIWYVGVPNTPYEMIAKELTFSLIMFIVIELIIGISLIWIVATRAIKPLQRTKDVAKEIAAGNLIVDPINIKSKDEIGQLGEAINNMVGSLKGMIININQTVDNLSTSAKEISESADQTAVSAEQVTTSIQKVTEGVESQKNSTEESSKLTDENANNIKKIADASSTVSESSNQTLKQAEQGYTLINQTVEQMSKVDDSVQHSITTISSLEAHSKEITKILSLISDIAEQTNLLALNAAIEAARAGEHGKGFAVVAEEVRKLAEQTTTSTSEVTNLISEIQHYSTSSVESMDLVNKEVTKGINFVSQSGEKFNDILDLNKSLNSRIQEISNTSEQLSSSSMQVAASIEEIAVIAQATTSDISNVAASSEEQLATMEELNALSDSLADASQVLKEVVKQFRV